MSFNLTAPSGFRGFDPAGPLSIYSRLLPHWRQPGATYFVTFHFADSLPMAKRRELRSIKRDWEQRHCPTDDTARAKYAKTVFQKIEHWLDRGGGACWLRERTFADELQRSILHYHEKRYQVGCFAIMANHCHLTMRPFEGWSLENEVGMIKKVVADSIIKQRGAASPLWQEESYDRIIRDEEHLYRVVQYIGANPRRAGLPLEKWHRWINPEWHACGWNFQDPP